MVPALTTAIMPRPLARVEGAGDPIPGDAASSSSAKSSDG